ncbi:hypothetical protein TNCV_3846451 [Trichonephila clavipes]|nr:hypothetical protein TNCV_3846451 [Trichonephila clavipes]
MDKGNAGLEDLRVKRNRAVESTGTSERYDGKRPKYAGRDRVEGLTMNNIEREKHLYCPRGKKKITTKNYSLKDVTFTELNIPTPRRFGKEAREKPPKWKNLPALFP